MKKLNSLEIILLLIIAVLSIGIFVVGDTSIVLYRVVSC